MRRRQGMGKELIETLWNVNNLQPFVFLLFHRINRNIVECKLREVNKEDYEKCEELIETLWNVNVDVFTDTPFLIFELIETYWNVDYYHN